MKISAIAAIAHNMAIGKNNNLLWHLPADMKFFREKTMGHVVITGRKNYESIPEKFRPLNDRTNIIVTAQKGYRAPGTLVVHSIECAMEEARKLEYEECFVIGGGQIYKELLEKDLADTLYITWIDHHFEADTFFPDIDRSKWELIHSSKVLKDEKNAFDMEFVTYSRNKR